MEQFQCLHHVILQRYCSDCKTAEIIIRNSYVYDIIQSVESVVDAIHFIQETERKLGRGGFRIKYWIISGKHVAVSEKVNIIITKRKFWGCVGNPQRISFLLQ